MGTISTAATKPALPSLEVMAACSTITKDMYAFAYRGESGAVHSASRVLSSHGAGQPPIAEGLMLHNALVAALVIFGSTSVLLKDERAAEMARRLQQAVRDRVPSST